MVRDFDRGKSHILEFFLNIIMQENPTPRNNPLLFWVAVLLQTEEFGSMPRFEFSNARDELTMRGKLEALVHYARVLILHHACQTWLQSASETHKEKLVKALSKDIRSWVNDGSPRPADRRDDPADFGEAYWCSFIAYFEDFHRKWLTKGSNSAIDVILGLL